MRVDRHMAGVSCFVLSSGHVMGPQLQNVTAMNGDCLAPPDAGFGREEELISYLSSLMYGCCDLDTEEHNTSSCYLLKESFDIYWIVRYMPTS